MARKQVVATRDEVLAERERRQLIRAEVVRLSGVPLPDRRWRYDYSIDEVYLALFGAVVRASETKRFTPDPAVRDSVRTFPEGGGR